VASPLAGTPASSRPPHTEKRAPKRRDGMVLHGSLVPSLRNFGVAIEIQNQPLSMEVQAAGLSDTAGRPPCECAHSLALRFGHVAVGETMSDRCWDRLARGRAVETAQERA
jgi:hypothetical protein